jgi:hypothetical protein
MACNSKQKTSTVSKATSNCCGTGIIVSPLDGVDTFIDPCALSENCDPCSSDPIGNFPIYLTVLQSFNMPACGGTADITVSDSSRFIRGSVIYSEDVGYLKITALVDETTIRVLNECLECNAKDPGEQVPAGTAFAIGIPTCGNVGTSGVPAGTPFLDLDFLVPIVGGCTEILVTNVLGLSIGDIIAINGFEYRIGAIPTTTQIQICNDGEGDAPGTAVYKDPNNDGILDYPIIRIGGQNPCTATPVNELGKIIGCSASGQQVGAVGQVENQGFFWDDEAQAWVLRVVDELATCVTIGCCLTLDPEAGACASYLTEVLPNTNQLAAQYAATAPNPLRVQINGDNFCITEVVNATTIRVTPSFEVEEITTYDEGAVLCVAPCCEQCIPTVEVLDRWDGMENCPNSEVLAGTGPVTLSAVPTGISLYTYPPSIAPGSGFEPGAAFFWKLMYNNESCCECRKYIKTLSNYEMAMSLPPDVYANMELRILKVAPVQNSQSFAAHPFMPDVGVILTPGASDLIPAFKTINTHKGCILDKDFVDSGEQITFQAHIRIVIDNRSGAPVDVSYVLQSRAWIEVQSYSCADATSEVYVP